MREALGSALLYASFDVNALLIGEPGSGKTFFAGMMHQHSRRADKPFIAVNCAAFPEPLVESEIFGHVKGAFSGATTNKIGLIAAANRGTLFLDEIGDLGLPSQAKLLRAIETRLYRPVGAFKEEQSDFRLISATNQDLNRMMREGTFRTDLYYRISTTVIYVPPLREHKEDIGDIASDLLRKHRTSFGHPAATLDGSFIRRLMEYDWPGNVRELETVIIRSLIHASGDALTAADARLPDEFEAPPKVDTTEPELERVRQCLAQPNKRGRRGKIGLRDAAKELGLPPTSLHRIIRRYGLR